MNRPHQDKIMSTEWYLCGQIPLQQKNTAHSQYGDHTAGDKYVGLERLNNFMNIRKVGVTANLQSSTPKTAVAYWEVINSAKIK